MIKILVFSTLVAVVVQATDDIRHFNYTIPQMDPHFTIPVANFGNLSHHAKNCTMLVDTHVTLYCENKHAQDYFLELGTYSQLMAGKDFKQKSNSVNKLNSPLTMISQNGNYLSFYDD